MWGGLSCILVLDPKVFSWPNYKDDESISFSFLLLSCRSIFVNTVYNDWWSKKFQLNLLFQLVFLLIPLSFKNWNLGKCFINICIKKHISFSSFMPTITSYFGFLLAALTITSALFIGLSKIRLIWKLIQWTNNS